jgi:hypothetical protein
MVKKGMLYILFMLLIAESTGLFQLVKLPALYEHFREHQHINPEVNFLTFLSMHYLGDDNNDDDDERDMQLPFKKNDVNASLLLYWHQTKVIVATPREWPIENHFGRERVEFYFNPAGQSLFRPPRI